MRWIRLVGTSGQRAKRIKYQLNTIQQIPWKLTQLLVHLQHQFKF